jgi:iron complex transport system substrate-binding protein
VRIVSLVPSATELCFELDLRDEVIGVTHECDYPPEVLDLPKVTKDRLSPGLSQAEIDEAVRAQTTGGDSIYELDEDAVRELEPDLIITQQVCAVCAVEYQDVVALAQTMPKQPDVISLDPTTLGEVLADVRTIASATDRVEEGADFIREASGRIDRIRQAVRDAGRPTVAAVEWFDPVYVAGHWTPQLVDYAGGQDILGNPGEHSEVSSWEMVAAARPDLLVLMPCGYDAERSATEAEPFAEQIASVGASRVVAADAAAYFSRPGPRLLDGLELLGHLLHPDLVPEPPPGRFVDLTAVLAAR